MNYADLMRFTVYRGRQRRNRLGGQGPSQGSKKNTRGEKQKGRAKPRLDCIARGGGFGGGKTTEMGEPERETLQTAMQG